MTTRKSHQRKVFECYMDMKKGKSFVKYGKQTREDALRMYNEEKAKEMGMTMEEFNKWLWED